MRRPVVDDGDDDDVRRHGRIREASRVVKEVGHDGAFFGDEYEIPDSRIQAWVERDLLRRAARFAVQADPHDEQQSALPQTLGFARRNGRSNDFAKVHIWTVSGF